MILVKGSYLENLKRGEERNIYYMKKYLVNVLKGYDTTITLTPVFGMGESHSVPFTIKEGVRVCRTQREAKAFIETTNKNGGNAIMATE